MCLSVAGAVTDTVDQYLGIPYAAAPTGDRRFKVSIPLSLFCSLQDCLFAWLDLLSPESVKTLQSVCWPIARKQLSLGFKSDCLRLKRSQEESQTEGFTSLCSPYGCSFCCVYIWQLCSRVSIIHAVLARVPCLPSQGNRVIRIISHNSPGDHSKNLSQQNLGVRILTPNKGFRCKIIGEIHTFVISSCKSMNCDKEKNKNFLRLCSSNELSPLLLLIDNVLCRSGSSFTAGSFLYHTVEFNGFGAFQNSHGSQMSYIKI